MKWRKVSTTEEGSTEVLPGPAGEVAVALCGDGILFHFHTEDSHGFSYARGVRAGGGVLVVENGRYSDTYAPAATTRQRRVRMPKFSLDSFMGPDLKDGRYDHCHPVAHTVESVEEPPNPNRQWNQDDALVTARCGYHGWVQPKNMTVEADAPACEVCA